MRLQVEDETEGLDVRSLLGPDSSLDQALEAVENFPRTHQN